MLEREQNEAVSHLFERKDVFAVLPTGFGKSLITVSKFRFEEGIG